MTETATPAAAKTSLEQVAKIIDSLEARLQNAQLAEIKLFEARRLLASLLGVTQMSEESETEIIKFLTETGG